MKSLNQRARSLAEFMEEQLGVVFNDTDLAIDVIETELKEVARAEFLNGESTKKSG